MVSVGTRKHCFNCFSLPWVVVFDGLDHTKSGWSGIQPEAGHRWLKSATWFVRVFFTVFQSSTLSAGQSTLASWLRDNVATEAQQAWKLHICQVESGESLTYELEHLIDLDCFSWKFFGRQQCSMCSDRLSLMSDNEQIWIAFFFKRKPFFLFMFADLCMVSTGRKPFEVFQLTHDARAVFLFQLEAWCNWCNRWKSSLDNVSYMQDAPPGAHMLDLVKVSTKQLSKAPFFGTPGDLICGQVFSCSVSKRPWSRWKDRIATHLDFSTPYHQEAETRTLL